MKPNQKQLKSWLSKVSVGLPAFESILKHARTNTILIGAAVFEIYQDLDWIPAFSRKTGDVDLSVGLITGAADYEALCKTLLENSYTNRDSHHPYRYFSPKPIPGAHTYIDLLAHPANRSIGNSEAIRIMGAGSGFSFSGFEFASLEAFQITARVFFPNPFGMWALKKASYIEDPLRRIKDLADIIELGSGLVQRGLHFESDSLWKRVKHHPDAIQVREMLSALASGNSTAWDIENARQELLSRGFSSDEIESTLPQRLADWVAFLAATASGDDDRV